MASPIPEEQQATQDSFLALGKAFSTAIALGLGYLVNQVQRQQALNQPTPAVMAAYGK